MIDIAPAGDRAVLVNLGDEVTARQLHASAASVRAVSGVVACVPGHSSLLVVGEVAADAIREAISNKSGGAAAALQIVRVTFDGEDLNEFLERVRLSREEFLQRVDGLRLTARYLGFRGGFAYLDGWPEEWAMPRRATSRPVKRGSFAIAGNVAGFYPIDTPGGWNLLGTTAEPVEHRFVAGDEIAIKVRRRIEGVDVIAAPLALEVEGEDWSRTLRGLAPGGPFDVVAAALANKAVGNAPDAPLFECAIAGPRLRFDRERVVAWCGPDARVQLQRTREVSIGRIERGLRGYLAIGDREGPVATVQRTEKNIIRAMRGPHDIGIRSIECEVTPRLDRVGIRLRPLQDIGRPPADLKSCGMQCGTVQFHPDGSLVVMGPEHPVTGGYLQPLTVLTTERWKLAQLVPGERITIVTDEAERTHLTHR
ncbi:MAG TPA: carboxyltransferase domain-containing protein [Thermoanaerobaculia bacterium]